MGLLVEWVDLCNGKLVYSEIWEMVYGTVNNRYWAYLGRFDQYVSFYGNTVGSILYGELSSTMGTIMECILARGLSMAIIDLLFQEI